MEVDQVGSNKPGDNAQKKPKFTVAEYRQKYQDALNNEINLFTSTIDILNEISNMEGGASAVDKKSLMALIRDSQTAFISS